LACDACHDDALLLKLLLLLLGAAVFPSPIPVAVRSSALVNNPANGYVINPIAALF
jgi:hypothetical protein